MPIPHPRLCSESLSSLPGDQSLHRPHTQGMKSGETREAGVHTMGKGGGTSLLLSFAELYRLPSFPFKLCLTRSVWSSCPFFVMFVSPKKSKWGALVSKVSRSSPTSSWAHNLFSPGSTLYHTTQPRSLKQLSQVALGFLDPGSAASCPGKRKFTIW